MKILTISDTHSKHNLIPKEWMVPADVIVHAGDICNTGSFKEAVNFLDWFDTLNYPNKCYIAGNHDWVYGRNPKEIKELMKNYPNITYLQDSSIVIDGVKFFGTPWQPEFYNWCFNLKRGKELQDKWDLIELDSSVVISHGPVYDILDLAPNGGHVGCVDLLNTLKTKLTDTSIHICGHIHNGYGYEYKHDKLFINASTLNEEYMVTNKPILIDYNKETKEIKIIE